MTGLVTLVYLVGAAALVFGILAMRWRCTSGNLAPTTVHVFEVDGVRMKS